MFSGIVEEMGSVAGVSQRGRVLRLEVQAGVVCEGTVLGDSIAVNGVCLTVVEVRKDTLCFEAIPETLRVSNLGKVRRGEKVNLERSLTVGDRISGHFVTGHIDCQGVIRSKVRRAGNLGFTIAFPPAFMKYVVPKGSIAVDGISLTVAEKRSAAVELYIIPHTLSNTTLASKGPGQPVNLEFDMLLKRE